LRDTNRSSLIGALGNSLSLETLDKIDVTSRPELAELAALRVESNMLYRELVDARKAMINIWVKDSATKVRNSVTQDKNSVTKVRNSVTKVRNSVTQDRSSGHEDALGLGAIFGEYEIDSKRSFGEALRKTRHQSRARLPEHHI
jgi:hypothetical protein